MLRKTLIQLLILFTAPFVYSIPGSDASSEEESSEERDECGQLYRQCLRRLPEKRPVCGTDGNTYASICRLYYTNCWLYAGGVYPLVYAKLSKAFDGPCTPITTATPTDAATTIDPLLEPKRPGCHFLCPDSRDNVMVCGSDGVTYLSQCYLNWLNCRRETLITVEHNGPCLDFGTAQPATVPVTSGGGGAGNIPRAAPTNAPTTPPPTTPCSQYCPLVSDPVCGTDGNTYISPCLLEVQACLNKDKGLKVGYKGVCENLQPKTANETQPCPRVETCPLLYLPVCGSDGLTYQSECHLLAKACTSADITHRRLAVISIGKCLDASAPKDCGLCPEVWEPVCGLDNSTYYSECHLRQYACLQNLRYHRVAYRGICKAGLIKCPDYCPLGVNDPVCGTDGNTYPSLCFLAFAACVTNDKRLTQKHRGECSTDPCQRTCPADRYQPVCSTNGDTFQNDCFLWVAMCRDNTVSRAGSNDVDCNLAIP